MITEKGDFITGNILAEAFSESLNEDHIDEFISAVESGEVTLEQCKKLFSSFSMTEIHSLSAEKDFYLTLLHQPDYPKSKKTSSSNRSNTFSSIIGHIESSDKGSNTEEYLAHIFENRIDQEASDEVEYLWFLYRVNEYWQYALGTIFWVAMNTLKEHNGALPKVELIDTIIEKILVTGSVNSGESIRDLFKDPDIKTLRSLSEIITEAVKRDNTDEALSSSFGLLKSILGLNRDKIEVEFNILIELGLVHSMSFWSDYLEMEGNQDFEMAVEAFLKKFISTYILNRHKQVALRKLGNGSRSSIKFTEERGFYFYKGNFSPSFTNPRIGTALNMLNDLGTIKQDGDYYKIEA